MLTTDRAARIAAERAQAWADAPDLIARHRISDRTLAYALYQRGALTASQFLAVRDTLTR